tara:strand:- start:393 stop:1415 length:1023 start_codon:yes stop_codon:yes gene_type:complete
MKDLFCIILAGGIGSRFFPLSNEEQPKQFLDFFNEKESLIQKTFNRVSKFIDKKNIYILTNKKYARLTEKHLKSIPKKNILCEPIQKNTAASIALGSFTIHKKNKKAKILVCPSDHLIKNYTKFEKTCLKVFEHLNHKNQITTIGIKPKNAHTGYGYIKTIHSKNNEITQVKDFKEKPNKKIAKKFLNSKNYLWNSGIFIFSSKQIIEEYKLHQKKTYLSFKKILTSDDFNLEKCFSNIDNISFDYAILEKTKKISVIKTNMEWNDLGSYSSLYKEMEKSEYNNASNVTEKTLINSKNNLIILPKGKKIILRGIENYIIVEKNNTLLIYPKSKDQEIGKL